MKMKYSQNFIHRKMTEKLAGMLPASEEQWLDDLIKSDPVVRDTWLELQKNFTKEDREQLCSRFSGELHPIDFASIPPNVLEKPQSSITRYLLAACAAAAAIIISILVIRPGNRQVDQSVTYTYHRQGWEDTAQFTQLQLSNGRVVNLGKVSGNFIVDSVSLNGQNSTLSFREDLPLPSGINSVIVPVGKSYKVILGDGSEVWLNSQSLLDFPFRFDGASREISISGEAYVKVAQDADKPFIVHMDDGDIQVLGTEFNVNAYEEPSVKISLVKGAIKYVNKSTSIRLQPGKQLQMTRGKSNKIVDFDIDKTTAWRDGKYYFENASLEDICKILPRWYGVTVIMDQQQIQDIPFSGSMDRGQPLKIFLENLSLTANVKYYMQDGKVHFY